MISGDLLFLMRQKAQQQVSVASIHLNSRDYFLGDYVIDSQIVSTIKKIARDMRSCFSDVDSKEALSIALYATYQELKRENNKYLSNFSSFESFNRYYRSKCNNPFV